MKIYKTFFLVSTVSAYAAEADIQQSERAWVQLLAAPQAAYVPGGRPFGRVTRTVVNGSSEQVMHTLIAAVTQTKKKNRAGQKYLVYQSLLPKLSEAQQNMLIKTVLGVDEYACAHNDICERELMLVALCTDVSVSIIQQALSAERERYAKQVSSNSLGSLGK